MPIFLKTVFLEKMLYFLCLVKFIRSVVKKGRCLFLCVKHCKGGEVRTGIIDHFEKVNCNGGMGGLVFAKKGLSRYPVSCSQFFFKSGSLRRSRAAA